MDKEKEIEEIAKYICNACEMGFDIDGDCAQGNNYKTCGTSKETAEYIYNAGYRKVPDGAVVLLIGKNNQALDEKTIEYFVKHNEQIRKETAERDFCTIIKALEERKERVKAFYGVAESAGVDIAIRTVKELAKQCGVEIKEYEK